MLTDLAIDDGSFAWKLCMDIVCLSYDGNLTDAVLIAAMGALMRLKLPGTRRIDDEMFITEGETHSTRTDSNNPFSSQARFIFPLLG